MNECTKIFELPLFVREKIIFSLSGENLGAKLIPEKLPKIFSFFVSKSNKKTVGFLSEKDCLVRVVKMKYHNDISAHVKEIMSKNCFVIQKNEDLMKAIEYFSDKNFHIIPVVNEKNQVEGVLVRQDVFRYVVKLKQQSW